MFDSSIAATLEVNRPVQSNLQVSGEFFARERGRRGGGAEAPFDAFSGEGLRWVVLESQRDIVQKVVHGKREYLCG